MDEYDIEIAVGEEIDELTVPEEALDALTDDVGPAEAAGDLVMLGLTQQLHGAIHHGGDDVSESLEAAEDVLLDRFEERFGVTFGEMTGHSH